MKCPFCAEPDTKVSDSRVADEGSAIRRRRLCEVCQSRFITYERVDTIPLTVLKRDGRRETFDRNKMLSGLIRSYRKRNSPTEQMERIVSDVESCFINSGRKEIKSSEIGEMILDKLKVLDQVAYIRFASVYKQFQDIETFMAELSSLIEEKNSS